ncbi:MAG: hypothetical protein IKN55_09420 [Oscillospiraceae bacterium]|nr:hypothetical protein [Oscillospiraceae bacterium]
MMDDEIKETKSRKPLITVISILSAIGVITGIIANYYEIKKNKAELNEIEPIESLSVGNSSVSAVDLPEDDLAEEVVVPPSAGDRIITEEDEEEGIGIPPSDYKPKVVKLTDLDYFNAEDALRDDGALKDNLGQIHTNALGTPHSLTDDGFTQYYVNQKYKQISGTIFLYYDLRSTGSNTVIEFRGDGVELATFSFTGGTLPQDFELDIPDVNVLEIAYHHTNCSIGCYQSTSVCVGIDATLTKAE